MAPPLLHKKGLSWTHTRLTSKHKARIRVTSTGKATTLTEYPQVVKCLLRTYATDDNIVDTDEEINTFIQPPNHNPSQYVEKLVANTLRCGDAYEEQDRNEILIKVIDKSIRQSIKRCWSTPKIASLHPLTFHEKSILKLQEEHQGTPSTYTARNKKQNQRLA